MWAILAVMLAYPTPHGTHAATNVLLQREEVLNERCKDGDGSTDAAEAKTQALCRRRDALSGQLETDGWCWGHGDQIEADRVWERCRTTAKAAWHWKIHPANEPDPDHINYDRAKTSRLNDIA